MKTSIRYLTLAPLALVFSTALMLTNTAQAQVWTATNRWNEQFERKFSEYVRTLDLQMFTKTSGPWARIPTDCADAVYTLRTIFAYENRLPVSYTTWKGKMTNQMTDFDDIQDPVKRVRKFIAQVNYYTNTSSLVNDTYPIAIRRGVVRPGTLFLHPQGNSSVPLTYRAGHVYYLQAVPENGIIRYISSTVPAAVRNLDPRNGIIFAPMGTDGGYRTWIWPDSSERPNQSNMQFQIGDWRAKSYRDNQIWYTWQEAVISRVAARPASSEERVRAELENLTVVVRNRVAAVAAGWKHYQSKYGAGQCMSENDYSNYSTPTRDVKVQVELQNFELAAEAYVNSQGNSWGGNSSQRLEQFYRKIQFEVMPGVTANVIDLKRAFLTNTALLISEPEHHPEVRWGLRAQGRWPCPHRAKAYVGGDQISQN